MSGYCCGFGHRDLYRDIKNEIQITIEHLIIENGITVFLTGGMGDFDSLFSSAVRSCKVSNKDIQLILVKPYFSNELNTNKDYYESFYDDVIIPDEIAGCHYKSAITKRNRWMVEQSDVVLSGVYRDFGGAYDAIKYAHRIQKRVIDLFSINDE